MWILITIGASLILAGLARKFGSYTLLKGFMSDSQADALFPAWRQQKDNQEKSKK